MTIQIEPLTWQRLHCGATAERLAYHSRYTIRGNQTVFVIRCRDCRKTFCNCYGTAFYELKTPGAVLFSWTPVLLSFLRPFLVDYQKFRAVTIEVAAQVKLDKIAHSSSEKKSFSSYLPFSRSKTEVKGSGGFRRCLRSP